MCVEVDVTSVKVCFKRLDEDLLPGFAYMLISGVSSEGLLR